VIQVLPRDAVTLQVLVSEIALVLLGQGLTMDLRVESFNTSRGENTILIQRENARSLHLTVDGTVS